MTAPIRGILNFSMFHEPRPHELACEIGNKRDPWSLKLECLRSILKAREHGVQKRRMKRVSYFENFTGDSFCTQCLQDFLNDRSPPGDDYMSWAIHSGNGYMLTEAGQVYIH